MVRALLRHGLAAAILLPTHTTSAMTSGTNAGWIRGCSPSTSSIRTVGMPISWAMRRAARSDFGDVVATTTSGSHSSIARRIGPSCRKA